jgi:flagellar biosynthetic protein FliR
MSLLEISAGQFEKFLLILMRVGGIMTVSPFFGHRNIPVMVKIGFIGIFALVLVPVIPSTGLNLDGSLFSILGIASKELLAGLLIGFSAMTLFWAVQVAGQIIGFQIGFAVMEVIDPSTSTGVSILGQFQYIIAILIFLALDGHHLLINAVVQSFSIAPLGHIAFSGATSEIITRLCVNVFAIAIKIGAPVIVTLFLTDVALGILARTVPQMNVFIVGFPLKVGAGFLILAASFPFFNYVLSRFIAGMDDSLVQLIHSMKGAT